MRSPQVGTAPAAVSQTANAAQVKRHAPRREILKTGYGEQPRPCRPAGGGNGEAYAARNSQQALALKRNASSKPARRPKTRPGPQRGAQTQIFPDKAKLKNWKRDKDEREKRTAGQSMRPFGTPIN